MLQMHNTNTLNRIPILRDSMYRDRAQQFSKRLKWAVSVDENGHEIDQYDNNQSSYLIASNNDGQHMGSLRINTADRNCMLVEHFAEEFPSVADYDSTVCEITRFCLSPSLEARHSTLLSVSLMRTLFLNCLNNGSVNRIVGLCYRPIVNVYNRAGLSPCSISSGRRDSQLILAEWRVKPEKFVNIILAKPNMVKKTETPPQLVSA
ncbi:MAG: acyl-homoserine-lactone synthase [Litoreibacter sp.]